jgi:hypothetical protein
MQSDDNTSQDPLSQGNYHEKKKKKKKKRVSIIKVYLSLYIHRNKCFTLQYIQIH